MIDLRKCIQYLRLYSSKRQYIVSRKSHLRLGCAITQHVQWISNIRIRKTISNSDFALYIHTLSLSKHALSLVAGDGKSEHTEKL